MKKDCPLLSTQEVAKANPFSDTYNNNPIEMSTLSIGISYILGTDTYIIVIKQHKYTRIHNDTSWFHIIVQHVVTISRHDECFAPSFSNHLQSLARL